MKFKENDVVKVVSINEDVKHLWGKEGKIIAINKKFNEYLTSLNNEIWFAEEELELVENKNNNNIKLGDRVKIISNDSFWNGLIGKVIYFDDICVEVKLFDGKEVSLLRNEVVKIENKQKSFQDIANEIGQFTDMKNDAYGSSVDATYEVLKVLLNKYKNNDSTYTIPESLLKHILLQVRMIDKINRIFNNPEGDKLGESAYRDLAGYSLIGVRMTEHE